jgi:hypothetical protein
MHKERLPFLMYRRFHNEVQKGNHEGAILLARYFLRIHRSEEGYVRDIYLDCLDISDELRKKEKFELEGLYREIASEVEAEYESIGRLGSWYQRFDLINPFSFSLPAKRFIQTE